MNLRELKKLVDLTIENLQSHQNPEEINVLISLSEPSMGARASSEVKSVRMGLDWERGQFRIEPAKSLVTKGNNLSDPKNIIRRPYNGRICYFCPRCDSKISKSDKFCRECGQKLKLGGK